MTRTESYFTCHYYEIHLNKGILIKTMKTAQGRAKIEKEEQEENTQGREQKAERKVRRAEADMR